MSLKALEPVVSGLGAFIIALLVFSLVMISRISTHIQDVTRSWKAQPIVSIYAMSRYQEKGCSLGYVALSVNHVALPEISQAACGCAQNPFGYRSTNGTCSQGEHSDYCMSLDSLHTKESSRWRGSTFCIKRAGRPAAKYKGHFAGRPHPNKHGECPKEYKKCGDGRNQDEGAICFPEDVECPITSIVVLPRSDPVPVEQGWEPGGTFLDGDYALYFRREHINELPIINITVALSEVIDGHNTRGQCYQGGAQDLRATVQASKTYLWRYTATFPPPCETSDTRYQPADQMSLTDAYLRNLQAMEPACAGFQLLSLNDSRYNKSSDPDYLNSGVKCGTDPLYVCVRDPYQRTDCATGDRICNDMVHQNICGQYAHAVRSAFSDSRASLGLFFVREIEWSDHCGVSKKDIFNYRKLPRVIMSQLGWSVVLFLLFSAFMYIKELGVLPGEIMTNEMAQVESAVMYVFVLFPMLGLFFAALVKTLQLYSIYEAVKSGQCTDELTAEIITSRLHPVSYAYWAIWILFLLMAATSVLLTNMLLMKKYEFFVINNADEEANAIPVARATVVEMIPTQTARAADSATRPMRVPVTDVTREHRATGSTYRALPMEEV